MYHHAKIGDLIVEIIFYNEIADLVLKNDAEMKLHEILELAPDQYSLQLLLGCRVFIRHPASLGTRPRRLNGLHP